MKIQIKKILCPVDFSESSNHALGYAVAFAGTFKAELILVHVKDYAALEMPDYSSGIEFSAEIIDQIGEAYENRLKDLAEKERTEYPNVSHRVLSGTPFYEIINAARDEKVDLIVMGTHGRTGLAHVLMGSVAEKVVRKAPCPGLTVKHPEQEFVMP